MASRVVVAHDYLTQRGGAERVALSMLEAFPGARLVTSLYDPEGTFPEFRDHRVETMWPDRVPFLREDPRRALPVLAQAWSGYRLRDVDVVVASSSGWAHALGGSRFPKVVYCHNPARWLYQPEDYGAGLGRAGRVALAALAPPLRAWDRRAARTASRYLANSTAVRHRIASAYGFEAELLHPPTSLDAGGPQEPVAGVDPGYLLTVARRRGYKNSVAVCEAAQGLPDVRTVVVGGLPEGHWGANLTGLTDVSDAQLRWLYAHARGLVAVSHEDFGLTPVEGYAFGVPSVLLRAGGYLDSSVEGLTTVFVDDLSVEALRAGIRALLERDWDAEVVRAHAARFSLTAFQHRLRQVTLDVQAR